MQAGLNGFVPSDRWSGDAGMADLAGFLDMLRNADRFLPKQAGSGRGDGHQNVAEAGAGAETGLVPSRAPAPASPGDFNPWMTTMPAEHGTGFSGRRAPSGHKNDPIYMVAVGQATGMLMPMVPTSGTSTRSPPIPGQRNLP